MISRRFGRRITTYLDALERGERPSSEGIPPEVRARLDRLVRGRDEILAANAGAAEAAAVRERVLTSMSEGVILSRGADVVYANPSAARLFGVQALQRVPAAFPTAPAPSPTITRVAIHHPTLRELRVVTTDLDEGMRLVVFRDITSEARVEAVRRDFVANASHEMKTPVAAILATAETVLAAVVDDQEAAERFTRTLVAEARRLSALIEDLLDLARLDQPEAPRETLDLSTLVEEIVEGSRPQADAAGLEMRADVAEGIVIAGAPEDLRLLVRNLVDNAVRYTPAGSIDVRLGVEGDGARLAVADTGVGIPSKDLPRIFERFYRVDPARARETGGTGLGLAIVRHVAEAHGGAVTAESTLGAGSTFSVTLPLKR